MTLVEVMIAMSVLAISALVTLGTMTSAAEMDEELRDRSTALRAAVSKMEVVMAYDYVGNIQNLLTWLAQPANNRFTVDGLAPPAGGTQAIPASHGTITVNSSDPQRVLVTITVNWTGRRGARHLTLPMTVTEVQP